MVTTNGRALTWLLTAALPNVVPALIRVTYASELPVYQAPGPVDAPGAAPPARSDTERALA
jgi:hypothetical protein